MGKATFIDRADAICGKADRRQLQLRRNFLAVHPSAEQQLAGQVRILKEIALPPIRVELSELVDLGLPREETETVYSIWGEYRQALDQAEQDPKAIVKGDWPFSEPEKRAKAFGFQACALPS
jgi:hypothetical protein